MILKISLPGLTKDIYKEHTKILFTQHLYNLRAYLFIIVDMPMEWIA